MLWMHILKVGFKTQGGRTSLCETSWGAAPRDIRLLAKSWLSNVIKGLKYSLVHNKLSDTWDTVM